MSLVEGEGGVSVTLASCCDPVPGDEIVGYSSARRGITIHRVGCKSIAAKKDERKISVSWSIEEGVTSGRKTKFYTAKLKAEGEDREDLLSDATRALSLEGGGITGIKATVVGNSLMRMKIELRVRNLEHLYTVMAKLNEVRGIIEVTRD